MVPNCSQSIMSLQMSPESSDPDMLYEKDIMLTPEQAGIILADLKQDRQHRKRIKRKLTRPLAKLWTLPIPYIFDGSHSECRYPFNTLPK